MIAVPGAVSENPQPLKPTACRRTVWVAPPPLIRDFGLRDEDSTGDGNRTRRV